MRTIALFKLLLSVPSRVLAFLEERLARVAYRAYGATTGFKNYQGNPMPEWSALTDTIRAAWRAAARAVFVAGLVFGCLLGFAGALLHLSVHRPEPEVRTVERVVTKTVEVEKVVEVAAKQTAKGERVVVYRDRVVTPDGTRHEREIEAAVSASDERELTASARSRRAEQSFEQVRETTVEPRRDWRAGALVGVDLLGGPRPVGGLLVERRLFGNVAAGAWALSTGTVGASVSIAF